MKITKYTRTDYLNGICTHREYYAQFVTNYHKQILLARVSKEQLQKHVEAQDEINHKDRIPLEKWDAMAPCVTVSLKEYDDYLTLAGQVCILKEAAKQISES